MATITLQFESADGRQFVRRLPIGSYVLGRESACNVVVAVPGVSRRHAKFTFSATHVEVEDLGSSGGTFVGGRRLSDPTSLELPAEVCLGALPITLHCGEAPLKQASSNGPSAAPSAMEFSPPEENFNISLSMSGAVKRKVPIGELNEKATQRLEMLYDLPLQFAAESDLEKLYPLILDRVLAVTPGAVRGALMIKDFNDGKLSVRACVPADAPPISRTLIRRAAVEQLGFIWGDGAPDSGEFSASMAAIKVRTGMYVPLVWKGNTLGVLFLDNPHRQSAFGSEDLQFLLSVANYAAAAVSNQMLQAEVIQNNRTLQHLLANFSPKIRDCLLEKSRGGKLQPGGRKSQVTVLFSDLRGFTRKSATMSTDAIVDMLNDYLWALGEEIFHHDGTIDKFIGDAILAVFGSPEPDPQHAWKAVCAAVQMQHRMAEVNERRKALGLAVCEVGIGVHTGEVLHGFIGAEERLEYTVIGDTVNRTSRYCSGAGEGEVLLGPDTNVAVARQLETTPKTIPTKHEGDLAAFSVDWKSIPPRDWGKLHNRR